MSVIRVRGQPEFQRLLGEAFKAKQLVVVKFTASWCKPCQKIKPIVEQLATNSPNTITFLELDVDESENANLVQHFSISNMPSFVFIINNNALHTLKGADEAQLIFLCKLLQDALVASQSQVHFAS